MSRLGSPVAPGESAHFSGEASVKTDAASPLLDAAVQAAERLCGNPACPSPGKHPANYDGLTGATTDVAKITLWWTENPKISANQSGLPIDPQGANYPRGE